MDGVSQPNWLPPVQKFRKWLNKSWVNGSQSEYSSGLQDFVPAGEVEKYLSDGATLRDILVALFMNDEDRPRKRDIIPRYTVVFAILVSAGYGQYIVHFLSYDSLCDRQLPFDEKPTQFPSGISFQAFHAEQFRFCARVLYEGSLNSFRDLDRLPVLEKEAIEDGEGGSAKVYKVKVHARHIERSWNGQPPAIHEIFALKAYEEADAKNAFETERNIFKKLTQTGMEKHNVVGYYCSYEHRGKCYALLEFADMGTLEQYMRSQKPPETDTEILTFWSNFLDLIKPIVKIHDITAVEWPTDTNYHGIHQDIKPANILVKSKMDASNPYESCFGLADLGTSSVKKAQAKRGSIDNYGTRTYGSPECYRKDRFEHTRVIKITSKADIWSFLCVLSEVCIWTLYGYSGDKGVESYRCRRGLNSQGTDYFHSGDKVSDAVIHEHQKAAEQQFKLDPITKQLLENVLVWLHESPDQRPTATELRRQFRDIVEAARPPKRGHSRSTTISFEPTSPFTPRRNPDLANEVGRRQTFSYGSKEQYCASPRPMSRVDQDTGHSVPESTTSVTEASDTLQEELKNRDTGGDKMLRRALPHHVSENDVLGFYVSPPRTVFERSGTLESPFGRKPTLDLRIPSHSSSNEAGLLQQDAGSSRSPGPPAILAFNDAHEWRKARMEPTRKDQNLLGQLEGRDHVFVVDDSDSMNEIRQQHRQQGESDVSTYVDVLSYLVKKRDPDGVDLYYLNSSRKFKSCKSSTTLSASVRVQGFAGLSNPETRLKPIIETYCEKLVEYNAKLNEYTSPRGSLGRSFRRLPKLPRPLNLYVLTDGVWESPNDVGPDPGYLVAQIEKLIRLLKEAGCDRQQVGIQFIRFGDHEYGIQRLEALDQLGRKKHNGLDIVDTEQAEGGNVWKMLLGGINPRFDDDPRPRSR